MFKYNHEHNETTLGDIATFQKSYSFSREMEGEGLVRHIHYGDIHTKLPSIITNHEILPTLIENNDLQLVNYGDILIADASEDYKDLGKAVCYLDDTESPVISGLHTHRFNVNTDKVIPEYLINIFQTNRYRKFVWRMGTGVSVLGLSKSNLEKFPIFIPSIDIQKKVAHLFNFINKKINLQQEKIELLKEQKKGYMEKIFSKAFRFCNENGKEYPEWTQVTLKDIALSINYGMNAAAKEFDGKNIYLRITDIDEANRTFIENNKVSPDATLDEKYRLQKGDILFARTGASVGKSFYFSDENRPFYFAGFLIRVRLKDHVNSNFVYQNTLTSSYKQWVKIMSMRSGQPGINGEEYGSFTFELPCLEEQTKIANLLSRIDQRVLLEEKKLQILQNQKQSLIQQMFI